MNKYKKVFRYIKIYGFLRTLFKVMGRSRVRIYFPSLNFLYLGKMNRVGFIGAGQFSFATIGYFLRQTGRYKFSFVYDPDEIACKTFSEFYSAKLISNYVSPSDLPSVDVVYIASNHYSHCQYAIDFIKAGIAVYIEKPVVVNWEQFYSLGKVISSSEDCDIYVGYNRPFSKAMETIKRFNLGVTSPFSMSCFVVGHFIPEDHWYRDPHEGTRVCGNLGHWLDLTVHLLMLKCPPNSLTISVSFSNDDTPDDNFSVVLTSDLGDIINLMLTSRSEPFEGINETISFHQHDLIASITDFREGNFWKGDQFYKQRYAPKDVGHNKAILQHLNKDEYRRDLDEIRISSALMLVVKDMVLAREHHKTFLFEDLKYKWN